MPALSNEDINNLYILSQPYERHGSCDDCNGRCCNFIGMGVNNNQEDYFRLHGELLVDKWWKDKKYLIVSANCSHCALSGKCKVFATKEMPEACRLFPIDPFDFVYRYLMQIGEPCGFYFVNKNTGKKWDMRRKDSRYKDKK